MTANYFTKPLQGKDINIFCDVVIGYSHACNVLTADIPINYHAEIVNKIKIIEISTVQCIEKEQKPDHTLT